MSPIQIFLTVLSWIGAICIAAYSFPGVFKVLKTKETKAISIWMFLILTIGGFLFALTGIWGSINQISGISTSDPKYNATIASAVLLLASGVANCFSSCANTIIIYYKIKNMRKLGEK